MGFWAEVLKGAELFPGELMPGKLMNVQLIPGELPQDAARHPAAHGLAMAWAVARVLVPCPLQQHRVCRTHSDHLMHQPMRHPIGLYLHPHPNEPVYRLTFTKTNFLLTGVHIHIDSLRINGEKEHKRRKSLVINQITECLFNGV